MKAIALSFTLFISVITAAGVKRDTIDEIPTIADCRARAQAITGDRRKPSEIELIFKSPDGHAMAFCREVRQ